MGRSFYQNTANSSTSNFTYARIYPNRQAMDENVLTDGVYIGRYVLVEYDETKYSNEDFRIAYNNNSKKDDTKYYYLYSDTSFTHKILFTQNNTSDEIDNSDPYNRVATGVTLGTMILVYEPGKPEYGQDSTKNYYYFFQCVDSDNNYALFELEEQYFLNEDGDIPLDGTVARYQYNYGIDSAYAKVKLKTSIGRGYDSTV